ncbi:MAG: hypothetical protein IM665_05965 [Phenylobacterium sp.]|nr:hypothetical protein [Phenylobacterium sp.]
MTDADEAVERLTSQLNHLVSLESVGVMVKTTDLAAVLARAARVVELEAALAKANEPEWFYRADEAVPEHSLEDAIEEFCDYLEPGWHFVEIDTARPCKTIRGVVHILTEDEVKARGDDEPWVFTPCATEAEARALLKEADQ